MNRAITAILIWLLPSLALAQGAPLGANQFMASPSGGSGYLAPRALSPSDFATFATGTGNVVFSVAPTLTGLASFDNMVSSAAAGQSVTFSQGSSRAAAFQNITAASAVYSELAEFSLMTSSTGAASGNGVGSAFKIGHGINTIGHAGTGPIYGDVAAVYMDSSTGNISFIGKEIDIANNNLDYPESGAGTAVAAALNIVAAPSFPVAAAISVGSVSTTIFAFHDLIYVAANTKVIKDATIHDAASPTYSYEDTGIHAGAGFNESSTTPIGFFSSGIKSTAGYQDSSTTPYGFIAIGTYSGAAIATAAGNKICLNTGVDCFSWNGSATVFDHALKLPVSTVTALPACGGSMQGARLYVSVANAITFYAIVAGGGANPLPVQCDGTNWRID